MPELIYDVGVHDGADTRFYLDKGFDVVAVEANPAMVTRAREAFAPEIASGRLVLYPVALAEAAGDVPFLVHQHDDWSRPAQFTDYRFTEGTYETILVPGATFTEVYARHPDPRYVKLDIEGGELLVIRQMLATGRRPPYLSFEANQDLDATLDLLRAHGYESFYLLPQQDKSWITLPDPPREGALVPWDRAVSGPFGREIPGPWLVLDELRAQIAAWRARAEAGDPSAVGEWHDIHARLGDA